MKTKGSHNIEPKPTGLKEANEIYRSDVCHIYERDGQYYLVIKNPKKVYKYYYDHDSCLSKAIALSREPLPTEIIKNSKK
jgi:hypothetical protein